MSASTLRHRPIFGGMFGKRGRYSLATQPCLSNGLHAVRYMVLDPAAGAVLSVADDKLVALAAARKVLRATAAVGQQEVSTFQQASLWPLDSLPESPRPKVSKPVSRRRREIFERSEGRCHYCATPLTLDGRWHVEHMLPKALDGCNHPCNLVAACVPCNLAKADATAIEFVTRQAE